MFEEAQQARWNGKAGTTIGMPDSNQLWPGDAGRQGQRQDDWQAEPLSGERRGIGADRVKSCDAEIDQPGDAPGAAGGLRAHRMRMAQDGQVHLLDQVGDPGLPLGHDLGVELDRPPDQLLADEPQQLAAEVVGGRVGVLAAGLNDQTRLTLALPLNVPCTV